MGIHFRNDARDAIAYEQVTHQGLAAFAGEALTLVVGEDETGDVRLGAINPHGGLQPSHVAAGSIMTRSPVEPVFLSVGRSPVRKLGKPGRERRHIDGRFLYHESIQAIITQPVKAFSGMCRLQWFQRQPGTEQSRL